MIPTIETDRLVLIPPTKECFELYKQFYGDAEASKDYGGPKSNDEIWDRLKSI